MAKSPKQSKQNKRAKDKARRTATKTYISEHSIKNWTFYVIAILFTAIVIRLAHINTIYHSDLKEVHLSSEFDSQFFDDWAAKISEGDLLTNQSLHPYHGWHRAVASYAIPEDDIVNDPIKLDKRAKEIWADWYKGKQFHQEPFYPYFLSAIYSVFGHHPFLIFILQALISVFGILLLILLTKDLFNERTSLFAGGLCAFFGPAVFADGILLRASLITFFTIFLVYSAHGFLNKKSNKWVIFLGVTIGINLLLKFSSILLVFALLGFILHYNIKSKTSCHWSSFSKVLVISLLVLSPLIIRNVIVGAPALSFSSVGPITYINSNVPGYDVFSGFLIDFRRSAKIMVVSDGKLLKTISQTISEHDGLGGFIGLQFRKLGSLIHNFEIPNNFNFNYFKLESIWLNIAFVRFYLIFGLSILGLIFYQKKQKKLNVLHIAIVMQMLVLVAFYVISRFKLPFTICLIPFAAYAIDLIINWIAKHDYKQLVWLIVPILAAFLTIRPIAKTHSLFRAADISVPFMSQGTPRMEALADQKDMKGMLDIYEHYIALCPSKIFSLSKNNPPQTFTEIELAKFYQRIFKNASGLSKEIGDNDKGKEYNEIRKNLAQALKTGN